MSNPTIIPNIQDLNKQIAALERENATLQDENASLRIKYRQEIENLQNKLQEAKVSINTLQQDLAAMTDHLQNSVKYLEKPAFMRGREQQQGRGNLMMNNDDDDYNNNDDYDDDVNDHGNINDYDYEDEQNESINTNNTRNANREHVQATSKEVRSSWQELANKYEFPLKFCEEDKKSFWTFLHINGVKKGRNWMDRAVDFAKNNRTTITTYRQMKDWGKTAEEKAKQNKNNNPDLDAENEPEQMRSSGKIRGRDQTLTSNDVAQPGN